jgi:hypothetical protein
MAANSVLTSRPWKDYSRQHSLTITLPESQGKQLLSFTAAFISTVVGGAVWAIAAYITFQVRAGRPPHTVIHHQLQVFLRNSGSPLVTIWNCLQLLVAWKGTKKLHKYWSAVFACSCVSLLALTVSLGFFAASVFSSEIANSVGNHVLIRSDDCGMWDISETPTDDSLPLSNYQSITQNRTNIADAYARACYHSGTPNPTCNNLVTRELTWTSNYNATCPFRSGTCILGDTAAFSMTTDAIDSHMSLGINSPASDRITYRRTSTCAPLHTANYTAVVNGTLAGERIQMFFYGNISTEGITLNTYNISTYAVASEAGYVLS